MEREGVGPAEGLATLGAIVLLVGLFALPWYGVGEGKIAPIRIQLPVAPVLYAQLDIRAQLPGELAPPNVPGRSVPDDFGAWKAQGALGTIANIVLLLAALAALALAGLRAIGGRAPGPAGMRVAALGAAAIVTILLRIVVRPEDIDGYEFDATLKAGIFVALLGASLVAGGGLLAARNDPGSRATGSR